jgi:hypothetical protein
METVTAGHRPDTNDVGISGGVTGAELVIDGGFGESGVFRFILRGPAVSIMSSFAHFMMRIASDSVFPVFPSF